MFKRIYFVVQGLHEKSDSIGYDCVFQYRTIKKTLGNDSEVRLFAEHYIPERYPGTTIEPINVLYSQIPELDDAIIIYHFCDGWADFERRIDRSRAKLIVRWHNNTPPWFFPPYAMASTERSVRGFQEIIHLGKREFVEFWCNSEFTIRQLQVLGVNKQRALVVYPASSYLENYSPNNTTEKTTAQPNILFVSRITAHKGHINVLFAAAYLQEILKKSVAVAFPGRPDQNGLGYINVLRTLAKKLNIEMKLLGEVSNQVLRELYEDASIYCCLSEHEGFGLPVYEAMHKGVPVVAWANTALAEPLKMHPLCSAELDSKYFAAAAAAALIPEIREYVVHWQVANVLPGYTSEKITEQLLAGLNSESFPVSHAKGCAAFDCQMEQRISKTIENYLDSLACPNIDMLRCDYPGEISNNLVTKYDVASFEILLRSAAPVETAERGRIILPPDRFSYCDGATISQERAVCGQEPRSDHVVFGPFVRLSPGCYKVTFNLDWNIHSVNEQASCVFDVVAGDRILQHSKFRAPFPKTVTLTFRHANFVELLEFRIALSKGFDGQIVFHGVRITDTQRPFNEFIASAQKTIHNLKNGALSLWRHPLNASKRKKFRKRRRQLRTR